MEQAGEEDDDKVEHGVGEQGAEVDQALAVRLVRVVEAAAHDRCAVDEGASPHVDGHRRDDDHVEGHEQQQGPEEEGVLLDGAVPVDSAGGVGSVYEAAQVYVALAVVVGDEGDPGVEEGDDNGEGHVELLEVGEALSADDVGEHVSGHAQREEELDPGEVDVDKGDDEAGGRPARAQSGVAQEGKPRGDVHQEASCDLVRGQSVHEVFAEAQQHHHGDDDDADRYRESRRAACDECYCVCKIHFCCSLFFSPKVSRTSVLFQTFCMEERRGMAKLYNESHYIASSKVMPTTVV